MPLEEANALEYIPAVDENRTSDNPWSVKLHPMTAAEQRKYMLAAVDGKSASHKAKKASEILGKIFAQRIVEVKNLNDILGKPIETGAELYDRSETEYIDEIWEALTKASVLRDGLKND